MTNHELARLLLSQPDQPAVVKVACSNDTASSDPGEVVLREDLSIAGWMSDTRMDLD